MPIQILTAAELEQRPSAGGYPPYVAFLRDLRKGEGGRAIVADEGATRITVKNRLKKSAAELGYKIKFIRSPATEVVFQLISKR